MYAVLLEPCHGIFISEPRMSGRFELFCEEPAFSTGSSAAARLQRCEPATLSKPLAPTSQMVSVHRVHRTVPSDTWILAPVA